LFPGRRGAGRIFYNQVRLSGRVPQVCCLFGPSAAGGAYIPAFCDVVFMVEGNASMYLGSPRMVEMVVGEHTTLEEMGGARMHATVSGSADNLAADDADAIAQARAYFGYMPQTWRSALPSYAAEPPAEPLTAALVPEAEQVAFDMRALVDGVFDADSFFELKGLYAMAGPAFAPDACIALPTARIAIMGPEAAINAVYANRLAAMDDAERERFVSEERAGYLDDVDLLRLASELVIDAVVEPEDLRGELIARLALAQGKDRTFSERLHGIPR